MKIFWYVMLFLLIVTWIKILFFPVKVINNTIETWYDIVDKTINADNAIYNYEWFKQKYEDIQATKLQLDNTSITLGAFKTDLWDRKYWTFEDKNEYSRLNTVYLWQKNYLEWLIADYNARTKMANRQIFQDWLLPNIIEWTTFLIK